MSENMSSRVYALLRDNIDTDQIIPKQFLKRLERTGYEEFLFYDWVRSGEIGKPEGEVLVAGENFGCGSSREHAAWALRDAGFRVIIAPSFSDIFAANARFSSILLLRLERSACQEIAEEESVVIDIQAQRVSGKASSWSFELSEKESTELLSWADPIDQALSQGDKIESIEKSLPAISTRLS